MINIYDIIQSLVPDYKIINNNKIINNIKFKQIDTMKTTNLTTNQTFTTFFTCLLYSRDNIIVDDKILDTEINNLKIYMEQYEFHELINIKKMINLIGQNIINNELILFLSGYFGVNIYLYNNHLLKIYYLEDKLYTDKDSVIILLKKDKYSPDIGYQTLENNKYYKYQDDFIQDLIKNIYIVPIGLYENKKFEITNIKEESNFILRTIVKENIITENDLTDDIFTNNYDLEDNLENIFNNFKINMKKILKKYDRERMMTEINKYY